MQVAFCLTLGCIFSGYTLADCQPVVENNFILDQKNLHIKEVSAIIVPVKTVLLSMLKLGIIGHYYRLSTFLVKVAAVKVLLALKKITCSVPAIS